MYYIRLVEFSAFSRCAFGIFAAVLCWGVHFSFVLGVVKSVSTIQIAHTFVLCCEIYLVYV